MVASESASVVDVTGNRRRNSKRFSLFRSRSSQAGSKPALSHTFDEAAIMPVDYPYRYSTPPIELPTEPFTEQEIDPSR